MRKSRFNRLNIKFSEPKTLLGTMSPLILTGWVFGMGIFEYPTGRSRPLISFFWSVTHSVFLPSLLLLTWFGHSTKLEGLSVFYIEWSIIASVNFISNCTFLYFGYTRSKDIKYCLHRLNAVDEMLNQLAGVRKEYRSIHASQIIQLITAAFYISAMFLTEILWTNHVSRFPNRVTYFAESTSRHCFLYRWFIVDNYFATLISIIGKRLRHLNAFLARSNSRGKNYTDCQLQPLLQTPYHLFVPNSSLEGILKNGRLPEVREKSLTVHVLRKARKIHHELCVVAGRLNTAFGSQILTSFSFFFTLTTYLFYTMFNFLATYTPMRAKDDNLYTLVLAVSWFIFNTANICRVVFVCSTTTAEVRKAGELIHEVLLSTTCNEIKKEIHDFSLQLMQNPLRFTANGFFTLDYEMIRSIVSAVATYLVILIQLPRSHGPDIDSTNVTSSATNVTC